MLEKFDFRGYYIRLLGMCCGMWGRVSWHANVSNVRLALGMECLG